MNVECEGGVGVGWGAASLLSNSFVASFSSIFFLLLFVALVPPFVCVFVTLDVDDDDVTEWSKETQITRRGKEGGGREGGGERERKREREREREMLHATYLQRSDDFY